MTRSEFITCMDLHRVLKERVKGKIFIVIRENILSVYINSGIGNKYEKSIKIISNRLNIYEIADEIVTGYREFIIHKYFF